jgi:hypothetical protein
MKIFIYRANDLINAIKKAITEIKKSKSRFWCDFCKIELKNDEDMQEHNKKCQTLIGYGHPRVVLQRIDSETSLRNLERTMKNAELSMKSLSCLVSKSKIDFLKSQEVFKKIKKNSEIKDLVKLRNATLLNEIPFENQERFCRNSIPGNLDPMAEMEIHPEMDRIRKECSEAATKRILRSPKRS